MKREWRFLAAVALGVASVLVASCASTGPAPVEDRNLAAPLRSNTGRSAAASTATSSGNYRVQRGDTLYSIAFRHGVDYRELANWNHITSPYTIYVGQELHVAGASRGAPSIVAASPANPSASRTTPHARPAVAAPAPFEDVSASAETTNSNPSHASASSGAQHASNTTPSASPSPKPSPVAEAATPSPPNVPSAAAPSKVAVSGDIAWRWPADGQVVVTYVAGDKTRQGIDIAGKAGEPVRAAASGSVVYSGNGLIGYGELIIVKHSPGFLSAYGHNRKRLVKEGDHVDAGQVIAEMGSSSASRDSLHFEIRQNGKPVNPLDYLPRH